MRATPSGQRRAMGFFRLLGRAYVANRLLDRRYRGRSGYGRSPYHSGRRRGSGGFFGPVPYYSGRTRRGSRVTVGGCCLPIPLGVLATLVVGVRMALRG